MCIGVSKNVDPPTELSYPTRSHLKRSQWLAYTVRNVRTSHWDNLVLSLVNINGGINRKDPSIEAIIRLFYLSLKF